MEELIEKFNTWKEGIDAEGLKVNIAKTKLVVIGTGSVPQGNGHAQYVENALVITQYVVICVHIVCIKQSQGSQMKVRESHRSSGFSLIFIGNVREIFNIYLFHVSGMQDLALQNLSCPKSN